LQQDILTDVLEQPKLAPIWQRIIAALIDFVVILIAFSILYHYWGKDSVNEKGVITFHLEGLPALAFFAIWFLVIPFAEGNTGQTLGKMVLRIKVLKQEVNQPTVISSLVRHLFDMVDCFFLVGLIVAPHPIAPSTGSLSADLPSSSIPPY
jgi:uncharacterized RDD family membrane protein YckC